MDTAPLWSKPFFWAYGWGAGLLLYLSVVSSRGLCRLEVRGEENLPRGGYILAVWHRDNFSFFVSRLLRRKRFVCLNHPAWYMKPVHVLLRLLGDVELILGSTGHGGAKAARGVAEELRSGAATFINPDGPAGPPRELKVGVLHMSIASGAPIVPVRIELSAPCVVRRTWDQKRYPLPLSSIDVQLGEPIQVTEATFESVRPRLEAML